MLFQPVRKKLHVKLIFSALFVISLTAIIFGSIKSFAESRDENSIIARSKAEKRRPQLEPSRRLPRQISREAKPIFEAARTDNFLEILASGDLDATFGTGGKVTTPVGNSTSEAFAVALQTDGKFVAAGYSTNASNRDFALVRYDANGSPDASFGTGGKVTTDIGGDHNEILAVVIRASDGKIIVAGYSSNGANDDFTIAQYNPNGTLDTTFDTDGIVKTDFGGAFDYAEAILLQADGKIVVAGSSFNGSFYDFALARYNADGSPDTSFDGDGKLTTDFAGGDDLAFSLALQADGKLVAAGVAGTDFGLARYNSDGTPDATFDEDGKASTSINNFDAAYAVAIQTDGKIVAAGETDAGTNSDFALVRYNADGTLDTGFDTDGKVSTPIGSGNEFAEALTIQSSGKIIAAGHSFNGAGNADFALTRYNADGALDATFGTGGKVTTDFGNSANDFAAALTLQSNSRIIAVGSSNLNFAAAAYVLETPTCSYSLNPTSAQIPVAGGSGSFDVTTTAGCNWTATTNDSWITVTAGGSGSGNGTVSYSVQANTGPARTGTIVAGGQIFTINQASGCSYMLSANSQNFPANGGAGSFNVSTSAGCTWTAQANDNWITITGGSSGSGNGTVSYTVAANTGPARSGTITAAGLTFTVNQDSGCSYSLSATSTNFPAAGGNSSVNVTAGSGCVWTAASNVNWISVTGGANGNGNGTVTYTVQVNTGPERTGTLTIAGQTYTVTQANGCSFTIDPQFANFPASGGSGSFIVFASNQSCSWTATTDAPWISITSGSGTGGGTVNFTVQANVGPARHGIIVLGGQVFSVIQPNGCTFSLAPSSSNFTAAGGSASFGINTSSPSCEWTAISNNPWILITSGGSGIGTGTIGFTVQANVGMARTGTITAGGQTFTINQAAAPVVTRKSFDYDGDGKADLSVFRPSTGSWYLSYSSNNAFIAVQFGANGDLIAPGDFDGDAKTDICVFRPTDGAWYRLNSSNNTFSALQFGSNGDLPAPGDFDGDLKADITVYRPSAGSWYRINSSNNQFIGAQFGIAEDKPIVGDFDGDGKSDLTVFRPSSGAWYRINSADNSFSANQFGIAEDKPVPADYDGDGKSDLAVFRPSVGDWYIINSGNNSFTGFHFGVTEDKPVPADFDGDGKADAAVFRPSEGIWYLLRTTAGFTGFQFGTNGDVPTPNAFVR